MVVCVLDHDGGFDDYLALALLSKIPNIEIKGIIVTDGDCFKKEACQATRKFLKFVNLTHVPVVVSEAKAVNDFPESWKELHSKINEWPLFEKLNDDKICELEMDDHKVNGQEMFCDWILNSSVPVTLIVTGPLSNVAYGIKKYGDRFLEHIDVILLMGGAVFVPGNVRDVYGGDESQEWNIFWDPVSADVVFQSSVKIVTFSLDSTNQVPLNDALVSNIRSNADNDIMLFVAEIMDKHISHCKPHCYAWDTLPILYLYDKSFVDTSDNIRIYVITEGKSQGKTVLDTTVATTQNCIVPRAINSERFYSLFVSLLLLKS